MLDICQVGDDIFENPVLVLAMYYWLFVAPSTSKQPFMWILENRGVAKTDKDNDQEGIIYEIVEQHMVKGAIISLESMKSKSLYLNLKPHEQLEAMGAELETL